MEIILANERHLDDIVRIERENFSLPWSRASFEEELYSGDSVFLAAVEDGRTLGFAILRAFDTEGEVFNIAVSGDARRRGTGGLLLKELLKNAAEKGVEKFFLEVRVSNEPAINLYKKYGFFVKIRLYSVVLSQNN